MQDPLYDHDLDAQPSAAATSSVSDRPRREGKEDGVDPGRRPAPWAAVRRLIRSRWVKVALVSHALWCLAVIGVVEIMLGVMTLENVVAASYLGLGWLLAVAALVADHLQRAGARARRFRAEARGKGASDFVVVLAALGLIGGEIPRSLRVLIMLGLYVGIPATLGASVRLVERLRPSAGAEGREVVLLGEGVVRGAIERVDSVGYTIGTGEVAGGGSTHGGPMTQGPGRRGWVHIRSWGVLGGEALTVETRGRGIALQDRAGLRSWSLVKVAVLLSYVLLVAACVAAAKGHPIGYVLLATWAVAMLGQGVLIRLLVPDAPKLDDWLAFL